MRAWLLLVALGMVAVVSPIAGYFVYRASYAREVATVEELRRLLGGVSTQLQNAVGRADSARLSAEVRARQEGIARRQYHVSHAQALLARWWEVPGPFTVALAVGAGAMVAGLVLRFRTTGGAV